MGIEKFLGMGLSPDTELGQMGDEVMGDIIQQLKPLFDKFAKPFAKPAFEAFKATLDGTEEGKTEKRPKIMMIEVDQKTGALAIYTIYKDKIKFDIDNDDNNSAFAKIQAISDPVMFLEEMMGGALKGAGAKTNDKESPLKIEEGK